MLLHAWPCWFKMGFYCSVFDRGVHTVVILLKSKLYLVLVAECESSHMAGTMGWAVPAWLQVPAARKGNVFSTGRLSTKHTHSVVCPTCHILSWHKSHACTTCRYLCGGTGCAQYYPLPAACPMGKPSWAAAGCCCAAPQPIPCIRPLLHTALTLDRWHRCNCRPS